MPILVDTSILGRLANTSDAAHGIADAAVTKLHTQGEVLFVTAQNMIEFRNFATRPTSANGLGLSSGDAELKATVYEAVFPLLAELPDIYPTWKALVAAHGVVGKQVHDARLVAVCHVHRIDSILTFNVGHFTRLVGVGPTVTVIDPATV